MPTSVSVAATATDQPWLAGRGASPQRTSPAPSGTQSWHPLMSSAQFEPQARVPDPKCNDRQLSPPKSLPSHCSRSVRARHVAVISFAHWSRCPLPQTAVPHAGAVGGQLRGPPSPASPPHPTLPPRAHATDHPPLPDVPPVPPRPPGPAVEPAAPVPGPAPPAVPPSAPPPRWLPLQLASRARTPICAMASYRRFMALADLHHACRRDRTQNSRSITSAVAGEQADSDIWIRPTVYGKALTISRWAALS